MKKSIFTLLLFAIITSFNVQAQQVVSGVKLDKTIKVGNSSLTLNGAGIREMLWIDLYVGALYLPQKSSSAKEVINSSDAGAIRLNIVSGIITSDKMVKAVNDGFTNSTNGNTAPIRSRIDKFISILKEEIKKGDEFIFANQSGDGVVIYKNGVKKGSIEGMDFKKALFGIWLSDKPADKGLKSSMLGI